MNAQIMAVFVGLAIGMVAAGGRFAIQYLGRG